MSDQYQPYDPSGQQPYGAGDHRPQTSYGAGQVQAMTPEQERTWGAVSHGAAIAAMVLSAGFLGFLGSLAVYLVHKDRGPFVRSHSANSVNVQITMFIWLVVAAVVYLVLGIVTLGLGFLLFLPVFYVPVVWAGVLHVIGALKAYNGDWWNPPLTPRFLS